MQCMHNFTLLIKKYLLLSSEEEGRKELCLIISKHRNPARKSSLIPHKSKWQHPLLTAFRGDVKTNTHVHISLSGSNTHESTT